MDILSLSKHTLTLSEQPVQSLSRLTHALPTKTKVLRKQKTGTSTTHTVTPTPPHTQLTIIMRHCTGLLTCTLSCILLFKTYI